MRAVVCTELGPAERLSLEELPDPVPGPGEVVVAVRAAALNYPDTLIIEGKYQVRPDLPFVPGSEAAGEVAEVGAGVEGLTVGDRVISLGAFGAFAEKWSVPADSLTRIPEHLDYPAAAAFGMAYGTGYYALKQRANLQEGETLLVLGAAGGVGSAAVEIGKAMGARVIAAASTDDKLAFASEMGADAGINYTTEDLRTRLRDLTGKGGVNVVYDPVGGDLSEQALRSTVWDGRYLVIGFTSGAIPSIPSNLLLLKGLSLVGVYWGSWVAKDPMGSARNFEELFAMVGEGRLRPRVTVEHALGEFAAAFQALTDREAKGKVVLTTGS